MNYTPASRARNGQFQHSDRGEIILSSADTLHLRTLEQWNIRASFSGPGAYTFGGELSLILFIKIGMWDRVNDFIVPDHTTTRAASEGKLLDKTGMFLSV